MFKVTVLKTMYNEDLAKEYCGPGAGVCTAHQEGQVFEFEGLNQPKGFCPWAWNDIHKVLLTLNSGGSFKPWMKADNTIIVCCSDGIRPVVFRVERVDGK